MIFVLLQDGCRHHPDLVSEEQAFLLLVHYLYFVCCLLPVKKECPVIKAMVAVKETKKAGFGADAPLNPSPKPVVGRQTEKM